MYSFLSKIAIKLYTFDHLHTFLILQKLIPLKNSRKNNFEVLIYANKNPTSDFPLFLFLFNIDIMYSIMSMVFGSKYWQIGPGKITQLGNIAYERKVTLQ